MELQQRKSCSLKRATNDFDSVLYPKAEQIQKKREEEKLQQRKCRSLKRATIPSKVLNKLLEAQKKREKAKL